jgi:acyl dehydratase
MSQFFHVPDGLLGRAFDLGSVAVTKEMIAAYARAVGDAATLAGPLAEAPPTFCLTMGRDTAPVVPLPPDVFGVYAGHDIEFVQPIRAGEIYHVTGRVADVYEKSGRSGTLAVVVREAEITDSAGCIAARIAERMILRKKG